MASCRAAVANYEDFKSESSGETVVRIACVETTCQFR